jgi:hypothetical protein
MNTSLQDLWKQLSDRLKTEAAKRKHKPTSNPENRGIETESAATASESEPVAYPRRSNWAIKFTRFCLLFVAGCLMIANIKPYINIAIWLGAGLADLRLIQALSIFPPLAWLITNAGMFLAFITGFFLWALLQGLEMLPTIVLDDPEALLVLMSWVYQFKRVIYHHNDSALLRKLKERFNNIPLEWIEKLQQTRSIAYVVDGILCFGFYPPIVGGYDRLGVFLVAPSLQDVDLYNVTAALATMFGIEILYHVSKLLKTALTVMSEAHSHTQA